MNLNTFNAFRHSCYRSFLKAADSLFETSDALLTETTSHSFPELSFSPFFRRQWCSLYQGVQEGVLDKTELRAVFAAFAPQPFVPFNERRILGLDASNIPRSLSPTARDRTCLHLHNLPETDKAAITYGWQFSTLVMLPTQPSNQTYILDNCRIPSSQTPCQTAAAQLAALVPQLDTRAIVTADRYYGSAAFVAATRKLDLDKLLRIKSKAVFYREAPPKDGRRGAPRKDGEVFKCKEAATHGPPTAQWEGVDEAGKPVTVQRWEQLHFRRVREVELAVLKVSRPQATVAKRDKWVSWFVYVGKEPLALAQVVAVYARRYCIEHGYRFDKQALLWQKPHLRTPEQFELWSDLLSIVHNELVLALDLGVAVLRPWEKRERPSSLAQVRRGIGRILVELGTPAKPPKVRGKSPGRAKGAQVRTAMRYEVVRKGWGRRKRRGKRA